MQKMAQIEFEQIFLDDLIQMTVYAEVTAGEVGQWRDMARFREPDEPGETSIEQVEGMVLLDYLHEYSDAVLCKYFDTHFVQYMKEEKAKGLEILKYELTPVLTRFALDELELAASEQDVDFEDADYSDYTYN